MFLTKMSLSTPLIVLLVQGILLDQIVKVSTSPSCPFADFGKPYAPILPAPGEAKLCNIAPTICEEQAYSYRTMDGSCNNLAHPQLGTSNYKFARLLPPKYSDGIYLPTNSLTGGPLPNARLVSLKLFGDSDVHDPYFTLMTMQWGQIVVGDMSLMTYGTASKHYEQCCTKDGRYVGRGRKSCFHIEIPSIDLPNIQAGNECMDLVRTLTDVETDCNYNGGPVEQLNDVTSYIDLGVIYGNTDSVSHGIRVFHGGRLIVEERNGHAWLPRNSNISQVCDVEDEREVCYRAGDIRVNSSPGAAILGTMMVREHNRLADELSALNPHWSDEVVFQEARKINTAQFQHITYYELLPILLGRDNMLRNRLIYEVPEDYHVNDYDPRVDATILNEHATSAFRHFHTQVEGRLDLMSELRSVFGSLRLSDWFNRPGIIELGDNFDSLTRGMGTQPQQLTDNNIDKEIKHFLFRRNSQYGSDVKAVDIQRGRDHGLASYNDARDFCGLKRAQQWSDFADTIDPHSIEELRNLYQCPEDVDLTVGGSLEQSVPGALAGPTFLCIITEQFYRTRVGDRFFFENDNAITGFSKEQLREIRKATASRIMCDNGNQIQTMQPHAFIKVSQANPIKHCSDIPRIDLNKWIDRTQH